MPESAQALQLMPPDLWPESRLSSLQERRDLDDNKILSNLHIFIRQDKMEKEIIRLFEDIFLRESH